MVIKTSPSRSLNPSKAVADMKSDNALMVMKIILFIITPFFAENGIVPKTYRKSNKARQSPQTTLGGSFNSDQSFEKSTSFYFMDIALSSQTSFGGNTKLSRLCTNYFTDAIALDVGLFHTNNSSKWASSFIDYGFGGLIWLLSKASRLSHVAYVVYDRSSLI